MEWLLVPYRGRQALRRPDPEPGYPTETYFFLADFAPHDATRLAERLCEQQILVKPLDDRRLGPGFMRVTTARPDDNRRFVQTLRTLL